MKFRTNGVSLRQDQKSIFKNVLFQFILIHGIGMSKGKLNNKLHSLDWQYKSKGICEVLHVPGSNQMF